MQDNILSVSLELRNTVQWLEYDTLHNSLSISDSGDTVFPGDFVVSGRTLSGTLQKYLTDENAASANTWSTQSAIRIRVGQSSTNWLLDIDIPSAVYTNRLGIEDLLTQSYDFRMIHSPINLNTVIKIKE